MPGETVRIMQNSQSKQLSIAEVEIWGMELQSDNIQGEYVIIASEI